jgi:hypothetical protein
MKSVKTTKGTLLPLTNLKGKDYLMVAYRIQWMNEEFPNFEIHTEFPLVNDDQTIARATVTLKDTEGKVLRSATGTKRETKKDFGDHTEKAETAAIGRALAMLGFGTQFAIADLDEGNRIVDAPVVDTKEVNEAENAQSPDELPPAKKASSFRKPKTGTDTTFKPVPSTPTAAVEEEWS